MAKTLLDAVNDILTRANVLQGNDGQLSTLTVSSKQIFIDAAKFAINEVIEELYTLTDTPKPSELGESTITLVTDTRAYTLASDLVQLNYPLLDETNGRYLSEYPGGYMAMVRHQEVPANYTGLPEFAAIRPSDGKLYIDRNPTTTENGLVYKYRYDKDLSLSAASDTVPFGDAAYRAAVQAAEQVWNRRQRNSFDGAMYRAAMGRAAKLINQTQARPNWLQYRGPVEAFDPYAN